MTNKMKQRIGIDSFGIEYIPQGVINKIKVKSIIHNIFRIQSDDSIMCWFYRFQRIYDCRKK